MFSFKTQWQSIEEAGENNKQHHENQIDIVRLKQQEKHGGIMVGLHLSSS